MFSFFVHDTSLYTQADTKHTTDVTDLPISYPDWLNLLNASLVKSHVLISPLCPPFELVNLHNNKKVGEVTHAGLVVCFFG